MAADHEEKRGLAALLQGAAKERAHDIATLLLNRFGSTGDVFSASTEALRATIPNEPAVVNHLKLVYATLEQVLRSRLCKRPLLSDEKALIDYLTFTMAFLMTERFRVLFLNSKNRLIIDEVVANGCVRTAAVHPREIMRRAVEVGATAIIVVHNHPSCDPTPSTADLKMTQSLAAAASVMGIQLHDHLIITSSGYVSLKRLGHL